MDSQKLVEIALDRRKNSRNKLALILLAWLALFALALSALEISVYNLLVALPRFVVFFITKFLPPDFSNINQAIPDLLKTVAFAFVSSILSSIIALILALFMSKNLNRFKSARMLVRGFVSLLRNIPVVIWGSVLVYIFGIGSMVAILALIVAMIGFLTKSYADSIDEISGHSLEALEASGATFLQKLIHGVFPQFIPSWLNWTLYSFEIGVRSATILGLVGAGGIGIMIQTRISLFKYQEGLALILCVIALVLVVEYGTNAIRRRIR